MTVTLVLPDHIAAELLDATAAAVETACVLLARQVDTPGGNVRLLARALHWVPDDAYRRRDATALSISSHGYVPALAAAEADRSVPIWLHTHPGNDASPRPSQRDHIVDKQLADLFRLRAASPLYGALIIARPAGRFCFTGHIESDDGRSEIDRLWGNRAAVGACSELASRYNATFRAIRPEYSGLWRRHPTGPRESPRRRRRLRWYRVGGSRATRTPRRAQSPAI